MSRGGVMVQTEVLLAADPGSLERALEVLTSGGLVAFPTDTVYGLGAMAFSAGAAARIYQAKGRSIEKALPVLLSSAADLPQVALEPPPIARRLAARFWPGPLTLVVPRQPTIPEVVSALPTVGVRVPDHVVALRLLAAAGPMAVTSANRAGGASPRTAGEVLAQLAGVVDLILDGGETPGGIPSTVVDCTTEEPIVLREGPIRLAELLAVLGQ
jgi:L-threonylcarbamoyladenylate synthase